MKKLQGNSVASIINDHLLLIFCASRYHFQQLAEDNDAAQSTVTSVHTLQPQDATPLFK